MTIRVAVADDQALFCSGVQMLIESQSDLEFAGIASNGLEAVDLAGTGGVDVLLMDLRMPEMNGVDATRTIVASSQRPKVIVLTTFHRDRAVIDALQAGADGFLTKDATPDFLLASIRAVHSGQSVIAPLDTADLLRGGNSAKPAQDASIAVLTAREKEVFLLAARGLSNAEIAESAYISEATVKTHVRNVLTKLDLSSRVQLVAHAYENGLLK
ncbi:response regulator [Leifsonia sp. P73]|uniref:response regulator n=1 Tax=Leifsonia sp. P73 TaxID=3423959 RepID=UPI003DA40DEE